MIILYDVIYVIFMNSFSRYNDRHMLSIYIFYIYLYILFHILGNLRINGDFYSKYMSHDYKRIQSNKRFEFDNSCHKDIPEKVRRQIDHTQFQSWLI